MSEHDWLTVGARVATLRSDWQTHHHGPKFATVEKIGKRDVVLDDGQRFNVARLERRDGGSWGWTVRLLSPDEPIVAKAQAERQHYARVWRAKVACENFRFDKEQTTAADVILALAPLTGRAEQIADLFAPTTAGEGERGEG